VNKSGIPKYRRQPCNRGEDQAFVELDGKRHYLGPWDSPASKALYASKIREWAEAQAGGGLSQDLTVVELCNRFRQHAESYYRDPETGQPNRECKHFLIAVKPLLDLYGREPAADFGPVRFMSVRVRLVSEGKARKYVNSLMNRVRRVFAWGVANELIAPSVHQSLKAVPGLKRGRTEAPDHEPVKPVPVADLEKTKPFLTEPLRLAVDLQLLSAARPGEILALRRCDMTTHDDDGKALDVWEYRPPRHKQAHREHERIIYFGPQAQTLLSPFLLNRPADAYVIDPREGVAEHLEARRFARKTPDSCGNKPGSNRVRLPKREAGARYDVPAYCRAVARACKRANVLVWSPHRIRHTAATLLRKAYGLEAASVLLGHKSLNVTEIYAEKNSQAAKALIRKIG
jgi:integrase